MLLASNVARTYVQLGRLVEQREVATRALAQRDEMLGADPPARAGRPRHRVELRQGEGALPETRQQIEALDEQIDAGAPRAGRARRRSRRTRSTR